jgi:hypothetical protein
MSAAMGTVISRMSTIRMQTPTFRGYFGKRFHILA